MTVATANELAKEAYYMAEEKGFWNKPTTPVANKLALIMTEIAEIMEAHRKGRYFKRLGPLTKDETVQNLESLDKSTLLFTQRFEELQKDTFEDEIADTIIRTLDLAGATATKLVELPNEYKILEGDTIPEQIWGLMQNCTSIGNKYSLEEGLSVLFITVNAFAEQHKA